MAIIFSDGGNLIVMVIGYIYFVSFKTFIGLKFKVRINVIKVDVWLIF